MYTNKTTLNVAEAVMKVMEAEQKAKTVAEELKGNQHKIDANKNGKIDAHDFKLLRGKKTMKKEEQVNEAFPTVADGEKSLRAKEGKTSMGTVTKTKTGVVHTRDYEDDSDDTPAKQGRPSGQGAGKSTKKKKLSEMLDAYREKGISSLYEEPDNATFTKELEDQKAKFDGKKKGADVAKPSVQAVKVEQYEEDDGPLSEEQLDELSKSTLSQYVKKAHYAGGMADFKHGRIADKRGDSKDKMALSKTSQKREKGINKAVDRLAKEDVQLDERTLTADETSKKEDYVKGMKKSVSGFKARYGDRAKEVMYATATSMAKKD